VYIKRCTTVFLIWNGVYLVFIIFNKKDFKRYYKIATPVSCWVTYGRIWSPIGPTCISISNDCNQILFIFKTPAKFLSIDNVMVTVMNRARIALEVAFSSTPQVSQCRSHYFVRAVITAAQFKYCTGDCYVLKYWHKPFLATSLLLVWANVVCRQNRVTENRISR